ncbi:MAG: helix-turn-helix domain-containing protein [Lachnospiraceae bacterium]|nr:helix-turn-helix domain-containing protein [Lachnospiraceae bacterium]
MDRYVTGPMIRRLREKRGLTQLQLAERLCVSDKAVSKWETGRGYPDITLLEALAEALGVSVTELLAGEDVVNSNKAFNMLKMKLYVCPVCGNIIQSTGEAVISCCGITLPVLEAEPADEDHNCRIERVEDEYFLSVRHEMSKTHYISFIAAMRSDGFEIRKLYPEGAAEARFKISETRQFYIYCRRHGLFKVPVPAKK